MKNKKLIAVFVCVLLSSVCALFADEAFSQYYGLNFHGNMMGNIITADMKFVDSSTIDFTANLPAGKKQHTYTYKIVSDADGKILTEWYENGKLDKTVTFSSLAAENFVMEVKGKGKVKMQKK